MIGFRWKLLVLVLVVTPLSAQERLPERPALPRGADPNSWESYFDLGMRHVPGMPSRAEAAFCGHRGSTPPEPLYARWAVFHLHDIGRWERYRCGAF